MSSNLDMSLEDIIKMNKKSGGGGGDKKGGANPSSRSRPARNSGLGPARRLPNRSATRHTPYSTGFAQVQAPETVWKHDMYTENAAPYPAAARGGGGRVTGIETGTKLLISNLDYGVSDDDIKELFSEAGDLKRFSIHYDRSGRSKGTAEVVFSMRRDAEAAVRKYHNVQLDGKPMKIEIVGTNMATRTAPPPTNGGYGDRNGAPRSQGRGGAFGRLRGGGGGGGGRGGGGRGFGRNPGRGGKGGGGRGEKKVVVSAEDLDADLEKYHSEAMQTN